MADTNTDEVDYDLQTDELLNQDEPSEDEEVEEKPKTRAEKTAAKAGKTVEELKEEKSINVKLDRLKDLEAKLAKLDKLDPLLLEIEKKAMKAEFDTKGLDGVSFETFESEYEELISIGANIEKAKELALKRAKEKAGYKEAEERKDGRDKASHPPTSSANVNTHKFQLMSKDKFADIVKTKGTVYYKEYTNYCDEHFGGKYYL